MLSQRQWRALAIAPAHQGLLGKTLMPRLPTTADHLPEGAPEHGLTMPALHRFSSQDGTEPNGLSFAELFRAATYHKPLIAGVIAVCALASVAYTLNAQPLFRASSMFRIEQNSGGGGLPGGLAGLPGLGSALGSSNPNAAVFDRMTGLNFIEGVSLDLALDEDPYFTTPRFTPGDLPRLLLPEALELRLMGPRLAGDPELVRTHLIADRYLRSVTVSETDNGSILVDVRHPSPTAAARIANAVMAKVVAELRQDDEATSAERITFLSRELATAAADLKDAQARLGAFVVQANVGSQEALALRSTRLDALRNDVNRADQSIAAIDALAAAISGGGLSTKGLRALRDKHPIIDSPAFQRLIEQYTALSASNLPGLDRLSQAKTTTRQRRVTAESELQALESEARQYSQSSQSLAELEREVKIAEVTFTSMAEQSKLQSVLAGPDGLKVNVFSDALQPLKKTSPKGFLLLIGSALLGAALGMIASLIRSLWQGRVFTRGRLLDVAEPARLIVARPDASRDIADWVALDALQLVGDQPNQMVMAAQESGARFHNAWRDRLVQRLLAHAPSLAVVDLDAGLARPAAAAGPDAALLGAAQAQGNARIYAPAAPLALLANADTAARLRDEMIALQDSHTLVLVLASGRSLQLASRLLGDRIHRAVVSAKSGEARLANLAAPRALRDRLAVVWQD